MSAGERRVATTGGCHCGSVRFTVNLPMSVQAHACNCSICNASGFVGVIVAADYFELYTDRAALSEYRFNTAVARHWFCRTCGIKSFYRPRSNPDCVSINVHCLQLAADQSIRVTDFDGQNWEANAASLRHLSER